ncbi:MAG: Spy/CpxP family protein refolding chaperone [Thermodesulfobacteriota bacterium]
MRIRLKQGLILMAAVFLTLSTMAYAEAQKGMIMHDAMTRGHGGLQMGHAAGHHGWKASLNKTQKAQVEAMHLGLSRDMAPLKAELAFKKAQLKNIVTAEAPDMAAMKATIKEIAAIKAKMLENRYAHIVEMRKVLTDKQRLSFDLELISDAEHWHGGGHGGHYGGHPKARSCNK